MSEEIQERYKHLEKSDGCILNFANDKKNPSMDNSLRHYIFMYVYIHYFN